MYDKEIVLEILTQIHSSIEKITIRFEPIRNVNDFTDSPQGLEKLDSICMQIIAIGESLKNIDKITDNKLLVKYTEVDWQGAKGMRDIITHHYFDIDAEQIFWVCKHQMKPLSDVVLKIIKDLNK